MIINLRIAGADAVRGCVSARQNLRRNPVIDKLGGHTMATIRAILIYIFCSFEDYTLAGRNGAVRQMLGKA